MDKGVLIWYPTWWGTLLCLTGLHRLDYTAWSQRPYCIRCHRDMTMVGRK